MVLSAAFDGLPMSSIDPPPSERVIETDQPGGNRDWLILALLVGVMALLAVCVALMLLAQ